MHEYFVKATILNFKLTKTAEKMIRLNKYKRMEDGRFYKDVRIVCRCNTVEKATNYILNKFNYIAEQNNIKFKIEIFKTPNHNKKVAERLTKTFY